MSYDVRFAKTDEWKARLEEAHKGSFGHYLWIANFINMLLRDRESLRWHMSMVKLPTRPPQHALA